MLDSNHDGALTDEEVVRFARDRFRDALATGDQNHDRKLSRQEFEKAVRESHDHPPPGQAADLGNRTHPPSSAELFRAFDANHDGRLTAAETPEPHRRNVVGLLIRLGRNPDGYLTPQDFEHIGEDPGGRSPGGRTGAQGADGAGGLRVPSGGDSPRGMQRGPDDGADDRPDPDVVFRIVDRNRDGRVDRAEAEMAPPGPRAGMISLLKQHGLSSITRAEFTALVAPMTQAPPPAEPGHPPEDRLKDLDLVFVQCDRNHDGRLTLAELEDTQHETLKEIIQKLGRAETGVTKADLKALSTGPGPRPPPGAGSPPGAKGAAGGSRPTSAPPPADSR